MTKTGDADQGSDKRTFQKIVWSFAIAETLVWAAYYYSFAAFFPTWEADLGFSKSTLTGAFTISLVVAAAFAPLVGRFIDFGYGRVFFVGGAVLAAVLLLLLSQVTEVWQFYAVWFGIGVAMSGSLYEACFAIVTHSMGNQARRAITLITLAAGFASTVSFPSAHILTQLFDWRTAVVIFAIIIMVVAVPLILYGSYHAIQYSKGDVRVPSTTARKAMFVTKTVTFWFIAITFTLAACAHGMITTHMLPILTGRGFSGEAAVLGASMIGPMQVAGRLVMVVFERYVSVFIICVVSFAAIIAAGGALFFAKFVPFTIVFFIVFQGAGYGVFSIIRPTIIAELLGRRDFGIIAGLLAIGFMFGSAVAPTIASVIWEVSNYNAVILVATCLPVVSLVTLYGAWKFRQTKAET